MAEDIIDEIIDDTEDLLFKPKPGGMIERHRAEQARREEAAREKENADEHIEERSYKAVKVTVISPEVFATNIVTIPPGGTAMILPNSPYRYGASIAIITAASTVLLAKDPNQALGGVGFPLTTGQVQNTRARAQLYGFNPGGAAIQVATLAEIYGPESY